MTIITARMRKSDGKLVRVHPDGREEPIVQRPMRAMTPKEIEAAALSDPDNPPLTEADLSCMKRVPRVKTLRRALGLTQEEFATRYHIPVGTLRDWEQRRSEPDQPARAYLNVIARDPEGVSRTQLHMRWRVEISDVSGDDRLLRDVLEGRSIRLHEQAGELFLIGDPFEALETAGEVHALASRVQSIVTEIGNADSDILMSFQIDRVLEELENGERRHLFLTGSAGCFTTVGGSLVVDRGLSLSEAERKRIEEAEKEAAYQKKRRKAISRFVSAFIDERALQVQRLLQGDLNPQTMGHIADLIQDDIGGAMRDLVSSDQLKRFYRSINHPDIFGEQARHIISKKEPPPNPMKIPEARKFIHGLVELYLEKKAGLSPLA